MAWVRGIKEARIVQPDRDGRAAIPDQVRVVVDLPSSCIGGTIRRGPLVFLPVHSGAGPCGTHARHRGPGISAVQLYAYRDGEVRQGSSLTWSIQHLIEPLQHYYATRPVVVKPKLGAKHGGGNGQSAYL